MAKKRKNIPERPVVQQRLEERPELQQKYGDNALPLLGLSLHVQADDIDSLAAESLTDGGNDKKIDFLFIDRSRHYAAIAQGFSSKIWGKQSAEANKATDLISAAGWLFTGDLAQVPEKLRDVAMELRDAIREKEINRVEFLYIHNCHESDNVKSELSTAVKAASKLISDDSIAIAAHELGLESLDGLCLAAEGEIFVRETVRIPSKNVIDEKGTVWRSVVASVSGEWLHALHQRHGAQLFRANYRDFLGIRKSAKNINNGIKTSVQRDANNFWTYNNGITALVRRITKRKGTRGYEMDGISIINGAQTTGSIGECLPTEAADVTVVCRFVVCQDRKVLHKIIQYNNTQNAFRSSDQRSNDPMQKRLRAELQKYQIIYSARRSGATRLSGSITAEGIAPLLSAFHGEAQVAARRRDDIFDVDAIYSRVFPPACSGEHIALVSCLGMAIDEVKLALKETVSSGKATKKDTTNYEVLKTSTAKLFLLGVMGAVAEEIAGEGMPDSYTWRYTQPAMQATLAKRVFAWKEAVQAVLPLMSGIIGNNAYAMTRDFGKVAEFGNQVSSIINAAGQALTNRFAPIRDITEW